MPMGIVNVNRFTGFEMKNRCPPQIAGWSIEIDDIGAQIMLIIIDLLKRANLEFFHSSYRHGCVTTKESTD